MRLGYTSHALHVDISEWICVTALLSCHQQYDVVLYSFYLSTNILYAQKKLERLKDRGGKRKLLQWEKVRIFGSTTRTFNVIRCGVMWCDACYVNYISICLMEWNPLFNPSMAIRHLFANLQARTEIFIQHALCTSLYLGEQHQHLRTQHNTTHTHL